MATAAAPADGSSCCAALPAGGSVVGDGPGGRGGSPDGDGRGDCTEAEGGGALGGGSALGGAAAAETDGEGAGWGTELGGACCTGSPSAGFTWTCAAAVSESCRLPPQATDAHAAKPTSAQTVCLKPADISLPVINPGVFESGPPKAYDAPHVGVKVRHARAHGTRRGVRKREALIAQAAPAVDTVKRAIHWDVERGPRNPRSGSPRTVSRRKRSTP